MVVNWLVPMHGKSQSACLTLWQLSCCVERVDSEDWGPTFLLAKKMLTLIVGALCLSYHFFPLQTSDNSDYEYF